MSLSVVYTRASLGIQAPPVVVETHLSAGLPAFNIVGLPETAVKESKDRVRSALLMSQFEFPAQRITVNLAPADLPKDGGRYDLPIAIGILVASGQVEPRRLQNHEFVGELALSGDLRPVSGSLPVARACAQAHRQLILPVANGDEAAVGGNDHLLAAKHLLEVCAYLNGKGELALPSIVGTSAGKIPTYPDLSDVKGQATAKRALLIAAAGGHHLLFVGPPGTGKTMLASRLPGLLPPLTQEEAFDVAALASVSNHGFDASHWAVRPFRQPHHTSSGAALAGGGQIPRPGEISLAHNGVLFLDELPEFDRKVLEVLREPLESGRVSIARAAAKVEFPARFQLVAAMNPCPCGHYGAARCRCTPHEVRRYLNKLSGPFLDRIDLQAEVPPLPKAGLFQSSSQSEPSSAEWAQKVAHCRSKQLSRQGQLNSLLQGKALHQHAPLTPPLQHLLEQAMEQFGLSARACHRILRVARTAADLDEQGAIAQNHLLEALSFRKLDRLQQQLPAFV